MILPLSTRTRRAAFALTLVSSTAFAQSTAFSHRTMVFLQFGKKVEDLGGYQSNFALTTRSGATYSAHQLATYFPNKQLVITDIVVAAKRSSLDQHKEGVTLTLLTSQGSLPPMGNNKFPYSRLSLNFPAASFETTVEQHFTAGLVITPPDLPFFTIRPADGTGNTPAGFDKDISIYAYGYFVDK